MKKVYVYDPTASDKLSAVRGVGRYLQILKENFSEWTFTNNLTMKQFNNETIFINPFFNFLQKPVTLKRIAHKQIAVIHDLIPLKYPSHFPVGIKGTIYILLNKFALKNYDLIITDSEASKKDIIKILGIKEDKIKVIYPCLPKMFISPHVIARSRDPSLSLRASAKQSHNDSSGQAPQSQKGIATLPEFIPPKAGVARNDIESSFCLYVGDATWNKNLVNLAKAIKLADIKCVFVGKVFDHFNTPHNPLSRGDERGVSDHPWQQELKEFFELTKNDSRFIIKGFVTDSELIKLYQQSTVNILPSRDEGFGFSWLEASSTGCPSLLSDIPVLKEISDNNALFFNPENPQEIAQQIKKIYSDLNLRQKLITNSKKRSLFFSSKSFKENIIMQI